MTYPFSFHVFSTSSRPKVGERRFNDIKNSLIVLFIANTTIWIGNLIQTINNGKTILEPNLTDLDLGLIFIFLNLFRFIGDPIMVGFAILGWIFGGIWARKKVGHRHTDIMILSVLLPIVIPIVFLLAIGLTLAIGSFELFDFLAVFPEVIIIVLGSSIIGLALTVPGIVIGSFISSPARTRPLILNDKYHLSLSFDPRQLNERVLHCPFRMKEKSGCSFLGYEAPDIPLICDYESQWRICYIYAHLYGKLEINQ